MVPAEFSPKHHGELDCLEFESPLKAELLQTHGRIFGS